MYYITTKKKKSLNSIKLAVRIHLPVLFFDFYFCFSSHYYSLVFRVMCLEWSPTRIQMHAMSEYKIS